MAYTGWSYLPSKKVIAGRTVILLKVKHMHYLTLTPKNPVHYAGLVQVVINLCMA